MAEWLRLSLVRVGLHTLCIELAARDSPPRVTPEWPPTERRDYPKRAYASAAAFLQNAYAAPAYRSTPPLAFPGEAIAYVALSSKHDGHMRKRAGRKANSPPGIFSGTCRAGCGRDRDRFGDCRCLNGS